jgi:hypothetical protein
MSVDVLWGVVSPPVITGINWLENLDQRLKNSSQLIRQKFSNMFLQLKVQT